VRDLDRSLGAHYRIVVQLYEILRQRLPVSLDWHAVSYFLASSATNAMASSASYLVAIGRLLAG
jgi:hypothetical protein